VKVGDLVYHESDINIGRIHAGIVVSGADARGCIAVIFIDAANETERHNPKFLLSFGEI